MATSWFGILAPARTPSPVVQRLYDEFIRAVTSADIQAKLAAQGYNTIGVCGDDFAAHIKDDQIPASVRRRAAHLVLDGAGIALASTTFEFIAG